MRTEPVVMEFRHPVSEVFDTVADPEKQLLWEPEMLKAVEKLTPGPLGKGSRYRGAFKGLGKVEYEYVEFEPNRRFVHRARMPLGIMLHIFTFEETPGGTRMSQEGEIERPNLLGKVAGGMMGRAMPRRFARLGAALGRYLDRLPAS
jgi:uncharacterized protein YndB with AHSA1/START domain